MRHSTSCPRHVGDPTRQAIVELVDGRSYEGVAAVADGGLVHFEGKRRIHTGFDVQYRQAGNKTWTSRQIREIRWIEA